jgi:hypothetical protein
LLLRHAPRPDRLDTLLDTGTFVRHLAHAADIAQLVEQLIRNQQVSGSSPDVGSTETRSMMRRDEHKLAPALHCVTLDDVRFSGRKLDAAYTRDNEVALKHLQPHALMNVNYLLALIAAKHNSMRYAREFLRSIREDHRAHQRAQDLLALDDATFTRVATELYDRSVEQMRTALDAERAKAKPSSPCVAAHVEEMHAAIALALAKGAAKPAKPTGDAAPMDASGASDASDAGPT